MIHDPIRFPSVPTDCQPERLGMENVPGAGAVSAARATLSPSAPVTATPAGAELTPLPPVGPAGGSFHDAQAGGSFVPVKAMEDVLALRWEQINRFGHTPAADLAFIAEQGRPALAKLSRRALSDAIEDMQFNKERRQIRKRLVKACALALAAIDALDAEEEGGL